MWQVKGAQLYTEAVIKGVGILLNLPYYYGRAGEQYAFFRIPKLLLTDERFAEVSTDAKLLYGLLLDRMELSYRNGWIDEQNRVFIIFTAEEVMSTLHCRSEKAARLFAELDSSKGIGLIERKRQGLGRPTLIYVKDFSGAWFILLEIKCAFSAEMLCNFQRFENRISRHLVFELPDIR